MKYPFWKMQFSSHFLYLQLPLRLKKALLHTHKKKPPFIQMWISDFDNRLLRVTSEIHSLDWKMLPHILIAVKSGK